MRKHGFSLPLDLLQIMTWVLFLIQISSYFFLYLPLTPNKYLFISVLPYTILLFSTIFYAIRATLCNPADIQLLETARINHRSSKRCTLCQASVHTSSKHCKSCEKCIENFDHHCRFLNNCIGSRNYKYFFYLLISAVLLLVLQSAISIYMLSCFVGSDENLVATICTILVLVLGVGLLVSVGILLGFHCWLRKHKLSTYDYVVSYRANSRKIVPNIDVKAGARDQYVINSPHNRDHMAHSSSLDQTH